MGDQAQDLGSVLGSMEQKVAAARERANARAQEMQSLQTQNKNLRNNRKRRVKQLSERNTALKGQLDEHTKKASEINAQLEELVTALDGPNFITDTQLTLAL